MSNKKLLDRLVDIEAALAKKNQEVQQGMADMNFLLGQKAELQSLLADPVAEAEAEPLHLVESVGEVVLDSAPDEVCLDATHAS